MDIAKLGFVVDSKDALRAESDLDRLVRQADQTEQSVGRAGRSMSSSFAANMGIIRKAAMGAIGTLGGFMAIRGMANMADTWSDLSSRVGLAVGDMDKAQEIMGRLGDMADRTYSSLELTAGGWLENATALREMGLGLNQSLDFMESFNNAMVVSGAKGDRAASVMNALNKAMGLGKLSGDNLNTVLASGGRFAELLAEELGTTTVGLRKMGAEGKITSAVLDKTLRGNLQKLRDEAEAMPATIADGFLRIRNAILQLVGGADQIGGVSGAVGEMLVNISEGIKALIPIVNGASMIHVRFPSRSTR